MSEIDKDTLDYLKKIEVKDSFALASTRFNYRHLSTGIFTLDLALGGGIPESGITLIYGQEASGKSTLTLKLIASCQEKYPNLTPVIVDLEGTIRPNMDWVISNGVDPERLYILDNVIGEKAVDAIVKILQDPNVPLVILDSIPALVSEKRWENSVEDQVMAEFAKLVQPLVQKVNNVIISQRKNGLHKTLVIVNQWRQKAGFVMGDPRILPGGRAQHFFSICKVELFNKEQLGKTTEGFLTADHNDHSFKVSKYKVMSSPFKEGEYTLCRNPDGELPPGTIDDFTTVVNVAQKFGIVHGAGQSWGMYSALTGEDLKFKTKQDITTYMISTPDEYDEMKKFLVLSMRKKLGLNQDIYKPEYNIESK